MNNQQGEVILSSEIEKELEKIRTLILSGKIKEIQKLTRDLLKKENLTKEEELKIIAIQSEMLNYLAKFPDSLKLSEKVLIESEVINNNLLKADAYLQKNISLYQMGKFKECQEVIEKGLELIHDDEKYNLIHVAKTKFYLLFNQGVLAFEFGDFSKGKEVAEAAFEYAEKTGIDYIIAIAQAFLGYVYCFTSELEKVEPNIASALEIADSLKNNFFIIQIYLFYASAKLGLRKFDKALEYFKKGTELSLEVGVKTLLPGFYLHIANIYTSQYNLDKALEYHKLALEEMWAGKYVLFTNIGYIYLLKNEIKKAYEYFLNALKDSKVVGEIRVKPFILYNLVLVSSLLKDSEQAEKYLKELEELSLASGFEQITQQYQLAKVLILKESTRLQDWFKAVAILEELLAAEKLSKNTRIDVLFHLVEIRLKELQVTADQEILTEVKKQIEDIQKYAEDIRQFNLLANIYRLKSQLALVELKAEKAVELLITAKTLAEEKNLQMIVSNIQEEQAKLEQQQNMWNRMKDQKAPLKDTLKEVHLDSSAKKLASETVLEVRDERTGDVIEYRKLFALKI